MGDNVEEGIARVQIAATRVEGTQGDRLRKHHKRSTAYLDERILSFVFALGILGLIVLWSTAESDLVHYGSFAAVILLTLLWGRARIRRIERTRLERERDVSNWNSDTPD